MKKHLKWIIPVLCAVLLISGVGHYFWMKYHIPTERSDFLSEYVYSEDVISMTAYADYVFVGYVEETHDYHREHRKRDFPESIKKRDEPYTEFEIKVLKNIKGSLKENEVFSFYEYGGITKNRRILCGRATISFPKRANITSFALTPVRAEQRILCTACRALQN